MTVSVTLATPEDLDRLTRLVAAFHAHAGIVQEDDTRRAALAPLLEGSPHGVAYLIGPPKTPVGYVVIAFAWSVAAAGIEGRVDEIFVREGVRGRGMAREALALIIPGLARHGVRALHVDVDADDRRTLGLTRRLGFRAADGRISTTRRF
ncbi:GNAT family N-acetyltransferase [Mesobaculum littorinae]|uniref:GNAT family N-acetyltransferase n=1 Tax=Mesobaculum littorinae TaxID=2486419 RepID=A0A438AMB5_9RHOB|nr:GNAT family N-acetyltransferase [Mesobaculum littorinae]RVV99794.1 GNAT family N-acetyltransferase [Mesobaculum littorinae]